jgi:hypothetical protein
MVELRNANLRPNPALFFYLHVMMLKLIGLPKRLLPEVEICEEFSMNQKLALSLTVQR